MTHASKLKVGDQHEDRLFIIRKKPPPEWNIGLMSKIKQIIPFIRRQKQEQEDGNSPVQFRRQRSGERLERSSVPTPKGAGGEDEWKSEETSNKMQRDTKRESEMEMKEHEEVEVLADSDDAEGIVDALLAKYTT
ncbi:Glucose-methanol-choline oxidoreductase N-terminal [Penicillium sp. IBT 35674x]|nr:Glucose-methanol-choline oxidoreductase N-terminal [Penicillium sp. IBT 35674x]